MGLPPSSPTEVCGRAILAGPGPVPIRGCLAAFPSELNVNCSQIDKTQVVSQPFVITSKDPSESLDFIEKAFYKMALTITMLVLVAWPNVANTVALQADRLHGIPAGHRSRTGEPVPSDAVANISAS